MEMALYYAYDFYQHAHHHQLKDEPSHCQPYLLHEFLGLAGWQRVAVQCWGGVCKRLLS